jgi:hypothetical protein
MALLAVAVMVFAYVLTSRLNAASRFVGIDRDSNAMVLARAKRALIGYMAQQAALAGENNPGHLPCPEAPANFGTTNEGIEASFCAVPTVGRLPWRTLGLEKLVDAAGEPLWYAVSTGWHRPSSTATLTINSDTPGQLSLNGPTNDVVAVIIAPGPAITVLGGGPCTGWAQSHPTAGPPDVRNYLECGNEAGNYVTASSESTFNDQVLRVATADVLPALEAAIAVRMQREIAPAVRGIYASAQWGTSAGNPLYPFAAPFGHPGMSSYQGQDGEYQGLMPLVLSETAPGSGAPCAASPRCNPLFVAWTGGTLSGPGINSPSCTVVTTTTTRLDCTFYYTCDLITCTPPTLNYTIQAQAANAGMSLRQINLSAPVGSANVSATLDAASGAFATNGSATMTLTGTATPDGSGGFLGAVLGNTFCGLPIIGPVLGCKQSLISVPVGVLADHPLLDPANATTGWFVRNEWFRVVYYAAARESTADGLPTYGCDSTNCLRYNASTPRNIRSLLVLAGHSLSSPAGRPNGTLADYLEYQNVDLGTRYEQRPARASKVGIPAINAPFNDRLILVDWLPPPDPQPSFPVAVLP